MNTVAAPSVAELLASSPDYILENGIPRQKAIYTPSQSQTQNAFGFKWHKRDTYESEAFQRLSNSWLQERYALSGHTMSSLVAGKTVLDAGCGAGLSALLLFGDVLKECRYVGVDISNAVDVAAQRFLEHKMPGEFVQASLMNLPSELGNFDVILSEGVLHHTDSTEKAVRYLSGKLNPGGLFMFYVYKKKGPVREFTDDYIREKLASMTDDEAWKALEPLSKLGKQLGELDIQLDIEEPIDVLEIPAGKINLQRLFYWHIFKAYHRPEWTLDEMNHVNFDWYRPTNAWRQTLDEVRSWMELEGLDILKMDVQDAGITVIARKA